MTGCWAWSSSNWADVSTAGGSIVVYEQWRELHDPALLKQIEDYNATDCCSIVLLRDWLLSLRPKATPWFTGVARTRINPFDRPRRACRAVPGVTLNERLDYFGQTVNLADRVQGNDIYMSDEIYR